MKLALNIGSLAVVGLLSFSAFGQARPAPRPTMEMPAEGLKQNNALTVIKPGSATATKPTLEQSYQNQLMLKNMNIANDNNKPANDNTCGENTLAQVAARDGGINVVTAEQAVHDGSLQGGEGSCAVLKYNSNARRKWAQVGSCVSTNGGPGLGVGSDAYNNLGGACMLTAWQTQGGGEVRPSNDNAEVAKTAKPAFIQTSTECKLFGKYSTSRL